MAGSFRLTYPDYLTDGGRAEFRKQARDSHRELLVELARITAEQQDNGLGVPELNAQAVREAAVAAVQRRETPPQRDARRTRRLRLGQPSAATGSTILVTVGSVATATITPYLHSPWQWAVFMISALILAIGLGLQWITRTSHVRPS